LIRGEVWDRQENLQLKRQGVRHIGKGPIRPQRLFEDFGVGSFEVELRTAIVSAERDDKDEERTHLSTLA
jgi:hypothetical protein